MRHLFKLVDNEQFYLGFAIFALLMMLFADIGRALGNEHYVLAVIDACLMVSFGSRYWRVWRHKVK